MLWQKVPEKQTEGTDPGHCWGFALACFCSLCFKLIFNHHEAGIRPGSVPASVGSSFSLLRFASCLIGLQALTGCRKGRFNIHMNMKLYLLAAPSTSQTQASCVSKIHHSVPRRCHDHSVPGPLQRSRDPPIGICTGGLISRGQ